MERLEHNMQTLYMNQQVKINELRDLVTKYNYAPEKRAQANTDWNMIGHTVAEIYRKIFINSSG